VIPYGTAEVDRTVTRFLDGGHRPRPVTVVDALPLPGEDRVYESWSALDRRAEHDGPEPRFTDPWRRADTATPTALATPAPTTGAAR
jgi:hypothetical protein